MSDLEALRGLTAFADLDDGALAWLADHARFVTLEPGEALFHEGDTDLMMFGVLEGELRSRKEKGTPDGRLVVRGRGELGGLLPHSRLTSAPMTGRATERTRLACFAPHDFPEMLERIPGLQARLTSLMVDRSRAYTREAEERERLESLGRLAAGLAHELNNPAAAMQRTAGALAGHLGRLSEGAAAALERNTERERLAPLRALAGGGSGTPRAPLGVLAQSEAEDSLAGWLEPRGVADPWSAAETFVSAGVSRAALAEATAGLPDAVLPEALCWLEAHLASRQLLAQLDTAARRVSALIDAVKTYANMDRAPSRSDIDLNDGIRATLAVLAPALRDKGVTVRTELEAPLPPVVGHPAELNQVWTHLLHNALDASTDGDAILVVTRRRDQEAIVQIVDSGPGIPPELRTRVFEPFFTTKEVGRGTGLGLEVVRRVLRVHRAEIRLESEPGRTCFEVRFPAADPPPGAGDA